MTRVLIASASPVVRVGLEALLAAHASTTLVSATGTLASLPEEVETTEPDVVLLEVGPGDEPPLPLLFASDAAARTPAVVLLTDAPDAIAAGGALRAGARAVLPRTATADEIVAAVEAAAVGLVILAPELAELLLATFSPPRAPPTGPTQTLTPREVEVLGLLAEGLGNKGIAGRLGISDHTAKAHVASILAKLHVSTRAEAVAVGARRGLILL